MYAPFFEVDRTWNHSTMDIHPDYTVGHERLGARIFNTHLLWSMIPHQTSGTVPTQATAKKSGARYIYVLRDGRDVVTSFFHHLSNQANAGGFEGSFDEFFDAWLVGTLPYGRWVDHVRSWLLGVHEGQDRVLYVFYEELKQDLTRQLERIASFLGLDLSASEIAELEERVSFRFMKENISRFQPKSVEWKDGYSFIRKGQVGDHKNLLSPDQDSAFIRSRQDRFPPCGALRSFLNLYSKEG